MLASLAPHCLVYGVLSRQGALESRIFSPASRNITQIALGDSFFGEACSPNQCVNRNVIQTFALLPRRVTQGGIKIIRYVADRVLHASIVGGVGRRCKQIYWPMTSIGTVIVFGGRQAFSLQAW